MSYAFHTRGPRRFLPLVGQRALMIKGTSGEEVRWVALPLLGRNSGLYRGQTGWWHLSLRGRRVW